MGLFASSLKAVLLTFLEMNNFIFNHKHINSYYNCSGRTYEEWNVYGQKNMVLAMVYIGLGVIYLVGYRISDKVI